MLKFVAVLVLFVAAASATPSVRHHYELNAEKYATRSGRIVGGSDARIEDHPFQIALFYNRRFTCGGGIMNQNTIISAAHCTYGRNHELFHVLAGNTDNTNTDQLIAVSRVIEHERYDDWELENDIVILKLAVDLVYSDAVQPFVLPTPNFQVTPGRESSLAGWGTMQWGTNQFPTVLQAIQVTNWEDDACIDVYKAENETIFIETTFCAGDRGRDACQGDSGGPLKYNNVFVGIVSWGYECATAWPTVYTRVSAFSAWINTNAA